MSRSATIVHPPVAVEGRLRHLATRLWAAWRATRQRWQQADRMRAQHAAIRGLDRRTRQDLGLYADDGPWPQGGPIDADFERMRW
jgi:hypothetical protein